MNSRYFRSSLLAGLVFCCGALGNNAIAFPSPAGHGVAIRGEPESQFDFWVGDWTCAGTMVDAKGTKTETEATNSITKEFDGHVIHEHFNMNGFSGMSVSVYDAKSKQWRQTWVDDSGAYLAFTGTFHDGQMELRLVPTDPASEKTARMVFRNIEKDSFDWDWEKTTDGGKTWSLAWHLHYTRKAS